MSVDVSIVIPTYNPQERIFARVLHAVASLTFEPGTNVECVIVDNSSNPPLCERAYVRDFLHTHSGARVVREEAQGLTFARLAGFRATSGDLIVVLDDDNLPSPAYLEVAVKAARQYQVVGVWGPGSIDVELLDPVPGWLEQRVKETHSQRREKFVQFGCVPASWQAFYPIGMGQVIRREVADGYRAAVEAGSLNATDRKGGSLTSGGDVQIVWQAINMGLAAGVHPDLAMTHLIPESRATIPYLKRLAFGCGMSYYPAMAQSFPSDRTPATGSSTWQDVSSLSKFVVRRVVRGRVRFLSLDFANVLGLTCGRLMVEGSNADHWTFKLAKRLGLA